MLTIRLACLGMGLLFGLTRAAPALFMGSGGPLPRPIAVWASDRGAHRLVGLDEDLIVVHQSELRAPVEIEPDGEGGAWVLSATEGVPLGAHRLLRVDSKGSMRVEVPLTTTLDLAATNGASGVLAVEWGTGTGGSDRALHIDETGDVHVVAEVPGLLCAAAGSDGNVALGCDNGDVWLFPLAGNAPITLERLQGQIGDLAPGPRPGTFWALDTASPGRLFLLGEDLRPEWQVDTGLSALHLIPVPGRECVWLADSTQPFIRRYGAQGAIELERDDLPMSGLDRGISWTDGGVLLVAPGAVLHLDADGRNAPGQGGFSFLIDLALK